MKGKVAWLAFFAAFIIFGSVTMIFVYGCSKKVPPKPTVFKVEWNTDFPAEIWDVDNFLTDPNTGKGPVYRVEVKPFVQPPSGTNYGSMLLRLFVKFGPPFNYVRTGNYIFGDDDKLKSLIIPIDIGGNLASVNVQCEIWVRAHVRSGSGQIVDSVDSPRDTIIFEAHPPVSKIVNVEYDYHTGYNIFATGNGAPSATFRVNEAFEAGDTRLNVSTNDSNLFPLTFNLYDVPGGADEFLQYTADHHGLFGQGSHMYLVGVKNVNKNASLPPGNAGYFAITFPFGSNPNADPARATYIFMEHIRNLADSLYFDKGEFVTKVLVHELGHQRANLAHPIAALPNEQPPANNQLHDSPFCTMNYGTDFIYTPGQDNDDIISNNINGIGFDFLRNYFFCSKDVEKIKLVSWY